MIFTADNGPWLSYGDHAGSAGPLREGKGTMFDGGCREPTVMWWPGKIPAGTVCRTPAMTIDILPTIAAPGRRQAAGAQDRRQEHLAARSPASRAPTSPHEAYYFYWGDHLQAVRMGRWKLHFPHAYRTLGGRPGGKGGKPVPYQQAKIDLALFDLENDPGETTRRRQPASRRGGEDQDAGRPDAGRTGRLGDRAEGRGRARARPARAGRPAFRLEAGPADPGRAAAPMIAESRPPAIADSQSSFSRHLPQGRHIAGKHAGRGLLGRVAGAGQVVVDRGVSCRSSKHSAMASRSFFS